MMLSPEEYARYFLAGKDPSQLLTTIQEIEQTIRRLLAVTEDPDYPSRPHPTPSEETQLQFARLYLAQARAAYDKASRLHIPPEGELRVKRFQSSLPFISKVIFSIGGFWGGQETRTATIAGDQVHLDVAYSGRRFPPLRAVTQPNWMPKADFLAALSAFSLGEWHPEYRDPSIIDGTQWRLEIQFTDRPAFTVHGSNAYPPNFSSLQQLLTAAPRS